MAVASLPMYDLPFIRAATDAWWQGLARAFRRAGVADVPAELSRGSAVRDLWKDRDLLFSQTCGYPLVNELRGAVTPLATPCYFAPGCEGPSYCSVIVVSARSAARGIGDLKGTICAVNRRDSHSGYNVLRALVAPFVFGKCFFAM